MMLWDIIRDFFVEYVFGGVTSTGVDCNPRVGFVFTANDGALIADNQFGLPIDMYDLANEQVANYISMGDWLSTTATIIVLVLLCVCAGLFVRWMFKWIGGCLSRLGR